MIADIKAISNHTYTDLIKQRVFQIACGYEDANDSNDLRSDPALKAACDRLPLTGADLASQPTMSRFENSISRTDLYRIGLALLETFIESYDKPPKKIILDIDDTDDATHGSQQLSLFHAYYDEYCYLPVHLYEAETGKLITTILRPGRRIRGREAAAILRRVLDHILMAWPQVQITLRGDAPLQHPGGARPVRRIRPSVHSRTSGQPEAQSARRTADGAGSRPGGADRKAGAALYTLRLSGRSLEPSAPDHLQGRDYARKGQPAFCGHEHSEPNAQVSV